MPLEQLANGNGHTGAESYRRRSFRVSLFSRRVSHAVYPEDTLPTLTIPAELLSGRASLCASPLLVPNHMPLILSWRERGG